MRDQRARRGFEQALALHEARRFPEAAAAYRGVLALQPEHVAALANLGLVLSRQGKAEEAIAVLDAALRLAPDQPHALMYMAKALQDLGRWAAAEHHYRRALTKGLDGAASRTNLGLVLHELGRSEEAVAAFRQALALDPGFLPALSNLAKVLRAMGQDGEAEAVYRRAIAAEPLSSELHSDLGGLLLGRARFGEAVTSLRHAIALDPSNGMAHLNLGQAFLDSNRLDEGRMAFEAGIARHPDHAEAHRALAQVLLAQGEFSRGWAEYEWRWHTRETLDHPYHALPQPLWRGEPLGGRTILVHAEQGIGDTLQFARYLPRLVAAAAGVMVVAPPSLGRLLGSIDGITVLAPHEAVPATHSRAAMMSLPRLFETTLDSVPAAVPYLRVAAADVRRWDAELGPADGLRIGLAWAGNPLHSNDRNRSMPLATAAPLLGLDGVRWFSLQKDLSPADSDGLGRSIARLELGDFYDTACALSALDLVISVDTSVCHLAGALGRPVWVMLPFAPDWRWMLDREDSPWYPSMRLFRQRTPGDWPEVIGRIAEALVLRCGKAQQH